jgi:hypothetical protein
MRYGLGVFLVCALGACGPATTGFDGTWSITDGGGTELLDCPGVSTSNIPITGEILIIQNGGPNVFSSSTIVANINGVSETFTLSNANTAALQGSSNVFPLDIDGGVETLSLTSDNMVVNGANLSENASGTISGGSAGTCTFSRNISATQN